jgi:hypothetical protein
VLNEQNKFYSSLYSNKETEDNLNVHLVDKFFPDDAKIPKLNENEKESCEGMISEEECVKAIKSMQNGKSPGIDGLPVEFYKIFWKNIKKLVMDSFSYSYENENMSISQKQSIITLLPQKNNDIRFLKNWRSISLLNTNYKIMTKCIVTRLKNNLIKIINKNQSGFIKGRYIGDNIRSLLEVIDLAEEENLSCIVFSIDFEKAFNTISWKF